MAWRCRSFDKTTGPFKTWPLFIAKKRRVGPAVLACCGSYVAADIRVLVGRAVSESRGGRSGV
jgi:hypothetical protein